MSLTDAQDNMREALTFIRYKIAEFNEESSLGKTARKNRLSAAVMKKDLLMQTAKIEKVRHISIKDQRRLHIGIAANIANYKMSTMACRLSKSKRNCAILGITPHFSISTTSLKLSTSSPTAILILS
jgi:hypothetical protein